MVVLRRDRYTCRICRQRFRARELEVDHVIELAAGGEPLDYANLQAVCRPCHRRKTAGFVRWWSVQRDTPSDSELSPGGRDVVRWESEWFPA